MKMYNGMRYEILEIFRVEFIARVLVETILS